MQPLQLDVLLVTIKSHHVMWGTMKALYLTSLLGPCPDKTAILCVSLRLPKPARTARNPREQKIVYLFYLIILPSR